jgi:Tol biopolymer transport system component
VRQITWDLSDDRAPVWSNDGERIYYVRGDLQAPFSDLPTLFSIPAEGGSRELVFPDLQSEDGPGGRPLTTPAIDPRSDRLAFQQRLQLAPSAGCGEAGWLCLSPTDTTPPPSPLLDEIAVRVRAPGDVGELGDGPGLEFEMAGRTEDPGAVNPPESQPVVGRVMVDYYPAHRLYAEDGTYFFRPSWNSTADEIVFGDALDLRRWRIGDASSTPIPGTEDGITPAWSPDGQWIAFVRLERTRNANSLCANMRVVPPAPPTPTCVQQTTDYGLGTATVEIIRPDGTDGRVIGEGLEPAWSPDGRYLYVRRGGAIYRLSNDGGTAELVPDTEGGREPSVSPDGTEQAFARAAAGGSAHDIWIVPALP